MFNKNEHALLEILSTYPREAYGQSKIFQILKSNDLDWGEILEQSIRNKILPHIASVLTAPDFGKLLPKFIRQNLENILDLNKIKIQFLRENTVEIAQALIGENILFAVTKGMVFESILYDGNGSRYMNDIDFMIQPKDRENVKTILRSLGYKEGIFDWGINEIMPHSRKDYIIYELNPDHLPIFARLTNDVIVKCVHVDFANSLTWTSSSYQVPIESVLKETSFFCLPGYEHIQIPCFSPGHQFIFTALHFFREAWLERWIDWEQDINLVKFFDIIRLWNLYKKELSQKGFRDLLKQYKIIDPIAWVLIHIDRTFETNMASSLDLNNSITEEFLHSGLSAGNKKYSWRGTMRERIYTKNKKELLVFDPVQNNE